MESTNGEATTLKKKKINKSQNLGVGRSLQIARQLRVHVPSNLALASFINLPSMGKPSNIWDQSPHTGKIKISLCLSFTSSALRIFQDHLILPSIWWPFNNFFLKISFVIFRFTINIKLSEIYFCINMRKNFKNGTSHLLYSRALKS